jgi:dipeptide/tripeptide permease
LGDGAELAAGCEVCERIAFYAISANLVTYLTTVLHEDISVSARNVNNWSGTTFMTPLIAAFVADAYLGRYWTLATFSCGYFLVHIQARLLLLLFLLHASRSSPLQAIRTSYSSSTACEFLVRSKIKTTQALQLLFYQCIVERVKSRVSRSSSIPLACMHACKRIRGAMLEVAEICSRIGISF